MHNVVPSALLAILAFVPGALSVAADTPTTPSPASGQGGCTNYQMVAGMGPACRDGNLWRVHLTNGSSVLTHGPDPATASLVAGANAVLGAQSFVGTPPPPRSPACVSASTDHFHAIYAHPSDKPDQYGTYASLVIGGIRQADGLLFSEAQASSGNQYGSDYRFDCSSGQPIVDDVALPTPCSSSTFGTVTSDLTNQGYSSSVAKYWVYFDCTNVNISRYSGQGSVYDDSSVGPNNFNNSGDEFAVEYNYNGNVYWDSAMHEAGHNLGAVQISAPNTSGAWHCNDGYDIMCYADGGPSSHYGIVCADHTHFDCNFNDYFSALPAGSNYLCTHWDIGAPYNGFLVNTSTNVIGAPGSVTAEAGNNAAVVSWSAATSSGCPVSAYVVTPYVGGVAQAPQTFNSTTTSETVIGLTNGTAYTFTVYGTNAFGQGSQSTQTALITPTSAAPLTRVSTQQYTLKGSDGSTWVDMDPTTLSLTFTPTTNGTAIISGGADLFTNTASYNQDLGLYVVPSSAQNNIVAWKESGGGGTFSPTAAYVQAVMSVTSGQTYSVSLRWKSNRSAPGVTIYDGAGPWSGRYSPTRLRVEMEPSANKVTNLVSTSPQFTLQNSDGVHWSDMAGMSMSLIPTANSVAIITASADLFTDTQGYDQDIAIDVIPSVGNPMISTWKESGAAGGFSPNASFGQAVVNLSLGTTYTVKLQWKTNKPVNAPPNVTIYAGAGPIAGFYSPTSLTAVVVPAGSNLVTAVSTTQYTLSGSDGNTFTRMDPSLLHLTFTPPSNCYAIISGNADLFTGTAGLDQDLGLNVTPSNAVTYSSNIVAWKEGGGFAPLAPSAAFVQAVLPVSQGTPYDLYLTWKTNSPEGGGIIYAGAGPVPGPYSPTRITVQLAC